MKDGNYDLFYGTIYRIVNVENGRDYVGSTLTFSMRMRQHFKALREGKHYNKEFQKDFNEFGESAFIVEEIGKIYARWPDGWLQNLLRVDEHTHIKASSYNMRHNYAKMIFA